MPTEKVVYATAVNCYFYPLTRYAGAPPGGSLTKESLLLESCQKKASHLVEVAAYADGEGTVLKAPRIKIKRIFVFNPSHRLRRSFQNPLSTPLTSPLSREPCFA